LIALIQRVSAAAVRIEGTEVAAIGKGILALIGVERGDGEAEAQRLAERVLAYRIFADGQGKMNLSLKEVGGALLACRSSLSRPTPTADYARAFPVPPLRAMVNSCS
jgi:D-tyrosyl-tRNA(Tyr) deacylase